MKIWRAWYYNEEEVEKRRKAEEDRIAEFKANRFLHKRGYFKCEAGKFSMVYEDEESITVDATSTTASKEDSITNPVKKRYNKSN